MSADERRQEIVLATLPLLAEHGANVTTSQIAQAAGIAEGTIFRVFKDKQELLLAALRVAMSADAEVGRIAEIPLQQPLVERLVAALGAVSDYQDRLWALMRVLQESGWHRHELGHDDDNPRRQMQRIGAAIAGLFQAETDPLRLDSEQAASLLLGLAFTNRMRDQGMGAAALTPAQLVDLFLHGVAKGAEQA